MSTTKKALGSASSKGLGDVVLDAGVASIDARGFRLTTLEDVAAQAGVPLEQVLRRFPSRDHLAVGIFDAMLDKMLVDLSEEIEARAHLESRLIGLLTREIRLLAKHRVFARDALSRLFVPFSPAIALQAPLAARFIAYASEQIEAARNRREVARWVIPSVAATAFWALHLELLAEWFVEQKAHDDAILNTINNRVRLFVRALGGQPTKAPIKHEQVEQVVFKASAGKRAYQSIVIENKEAESIDADLHADTFRSARDRNERLTLAFEFDAGRTEIEPGGRTQVMVSVLVPESMPPGVEYRGKLYVPGVASATVAAVVMRLPDAPEHDAPHAHAAS